MQLGKLIRKKRRERELSQKKLGEMIGVSMVSIRAWEQERFAPRLAHWNFLRKFLDISYDEISNEEKGKS